jgi:hypothetical protein
MIFYVLFALISIANRSSGRFPGVIVCDGLAHHDDRPGMRLH